MNPIKSKPHSDTDFSWLVDIVSSWETRILSALDVQDLAPSYRALWAQDNPTLGFCSMASEALWFILGGSRMGWIPQVVGTPNGQTHWWLRHRSGVYWDITRDQFLSTGQQLPYDVHKPKGAGWMGARIDPGHPSQTGYRPSQKVAALLSRIERAMEAEGKEIWTEAMAFRQFLQEYLALGSQPVPSDEATQAQAAQRKPSRGLGQR